MITLGFLACGLSFAGPVTYEKIVVPEPICGPFYFSMFGGGSFFDDGEFSATSNASGNQGATANYGRDDGWIMGAAFGLRTETNWRFELELSHHQSDVANALQLDPGGGLLDFQSTHGDVETTSVMLNAVKEFGTNYWRPYLGAGVGLSQVEMNLFRMTTLRGLRWEDVAFGYQFMAGIVYDITDCFQAYFEYRISSHSDLEDALDREIREVGDLDLGWSQHLILGGRIFF